MKYCRNCGKETTAKICPHCGSNSKKAENYCAWCGNEVDKNAVMCPNCHEKLKEGFGAKILSLAGIAVALILFLLAAGFLSEGAVVSAVLFVVTGVLLLPFVKNIIKKLTFGDKGKRSIFSIARVVVICVALVGAFVTVPEPEPVENKVYKDQATAAAEVVFHEEVQLKNEASYVLNDSVVQYETTPYKGAEGSAWRLVWVTLDYSAENGFGGTNRNTYKVEMLFDIERGTYHRIEGGSMIQYTLPNE